MIPNELRGKKAVPFLEWCNEKRTLQQKGNFAKGVLIADGILDFFLQPFSVDMLVNLIKEPNLATINFDSEGKCTNPEIKEYQQAEEKVIFEGWGLKEDGLYLKGYAMPFDIRCVKVNPKIVVMIYNNLSTRIINIDNFINLLLSKGINLTFKK